MFRFRFRNHKMTFLNVQFRVAFSESNDFQVTAKFCPNFSRTDSKLPLQTYAVVTLEISILFIRKNKLFR